MNIPYSEYDDREYDKRNDVFQHRAERRHYATSKLKTAKLWYSCLRVRPIPNPDNRELSSMSSQSTPSKKIRILLYSNDGENHPVPPATTKDYDLIMVADISESPWKQMVEILEVGYAMSLYPKNMIDIIVEGTLGLKSVEYVKELAVYGNVTWMINQESIVPLSVLFGSSVSVVPFPKHQGRSASPPSSSDSSKEDAPAG